MNEHASTFPDVDVALAEATAAFAHWRATRHRGREPTPPPLRAMAVALLGRHRPASIARALAINPVALSRWASESEPAAAAPVPDAFVTLPPSTTSSTAAPPDPSAAELVLRWPHGAQLVARGPIAPATLEAILAAAMTPPPSPS